MRGFLAAAALAGAMGLTLAPSPSDEASDRAAIQKCSMRTESRGPKGIP